MSLVRLAGVTLLVIALNGSQGDAKAGENADNWLRGSGADLELRLKGEVVEGDGGPASNVRISGATQSDGESSELKPETDANRFEISVRVNRAHPNSLWIRASSANGERIAYKQLAQYEFRQAAIEGLKLTLRAPERHVAVKVVDHGKPVAGAQVKAELGFGIELRSLTNADGVAQFGLLAEQELTSLMAWTEDPRIGGYSFDRKPSRDPSTSEHIVELSPCRDQTLRFLDEGGSPVPGVTFTLNIATAPPDYYFVGTNEHFRMTTDQKGEAVFKWFPNWEQAYYYAELEHCAWVLKGNPIDSEIARVFKLKKAKPRRLTEGHVTSAETNPGGFFVTLFSFQSEQADRSDAVSAFTNSDGSFALDVLPDATYCAYVLDARWVGDIVALVPYQTLTEKQTSPRLTVTKGQPIEVDVTSGTERKPYANLAVSFHRDFEFNWREPWKTQTGTAGPQWWVTTDAAGRAVTQTRPGKMRISVYTPRWQTEKNVQAVADKPAKFELNCDVGDEREIHGQLVLNDKLKINLADVAITIGSLDANYEDRQELTSDDHGAFTFKTRADDICIYARTKDGRAAGSMVIDASTTRFDIPLKATIDFDGQLLGEGDRPVAGAAVHAYVRIEGKSNDKNRHLVIFDAPQISCLTDGKGQYTLRGLPCETKIILIANEANDFEGGTVLDTLKLALNEQPHGTIHRLKPKKPDSSPQSLEQK